MRNILLAALAACAVSACGGSDSTHAPAQVVLSASGASPTSVTIPSGGQVRFVNNDDADHQIASTACSSELTSPKLSKGGSFTSSIIAGGKSCSFNDSLNPTSSAFTGTITVQAPGTTGGTGGSGY